MCPKLTATVTWQIGNGKLQLQASALVSCDSFSKQTCIKANATHTPHSVVSVREGAAAAVAARARGGGGVEQVCEVAELVHVLQPRRRRERLLLRRRHHRQVAGSSLLIHRPPGSLLLLLPGANEGRPARARPLRVRCRRRLMSRRLRRGGGGGLAGEALHDGLEAGGVGADELRLDELDLHAGVLRRPPGALDLHGHEAKLG